ncbi:IclR family transcriptional regulator [Skermania sp. ID1734]|uniref:IclR family transcriptional regulator n=1 Tax=Skermania sp. ID1734 TaxID=2597516 RepID=UPI00117FD37F|nr:IclR family transcriptional regulator [Skermania sp. ID1734]TSD98073.1 IclR family transcriptional regulator [Skermania sp. ID1734]
MIDGLERATQVLDLFCSDVPEWSVTEVCRALQLPKTTVWEYMQAMTGLGLLRRTTRGRYRLGWRAFQWGLRARMTSEISGPARVEMAKLVETYNETVQLVSRYRNEVVYLEKISPRTGVHVNLTRVGERLPAHCTAAGKVLLSHLPPGEVRNIYAGKEMARLTEHSIGSLPVLESELAIVRERGYGLDVEETVEGMCCVAAPVRNADGDVTWALSMSFLEYRQLTHGDTYAQAIVDAAQRLSRPKDFGLDQR